MNKALYPYKVAKGSTDSGLSSPACCCPNRRMGLKALFAENQVMELLMGQLQAYRQELERGG